jgi:hypothetical protein
MDASKIPTTDPWRDIHLCPASAPTARLFSKHDGRRRLDCRDVARNRATRYARRRRIPRPLWPLIAAFVLIGLIFERRPFPAFSTETKATPDGSRMPLASIPESHGEQDFDRLPDPGDASSATGGIPEPRHRPPTDFLATDKEVAQIVAFLIRNRGRIDNGVVRAKWEILDRVSLPLAVHLREMEANAAWDDLEEEIATAPPGMPATSRSALVRSIRHRKLLRLMPEWTQRGEDLLTGGGAADTPPDEAPTPDGDDRPDTRPRKP